MATYKIWVHVEEIGDDGEKFADAVEPAEYGCYDNEEEALDQFEELVFGRSPDATA